MSVYVAFFRGINVGGNTMVSMTELAAICTQVGLLDVQTCLNSGNVIFKSPLLEAELRVSLERELSGKTGMNISVVIRNSDEMEEIVNANPFPDAVPSRVGVLLGTAPVPEKVLAEFSTPGRERVMPGKREVYIHYPDGMGRSKLKVPLLLRNGTVRNINTLSRLVDLIAKRRE
jgi:uncharacterized protein (DUF1697 family)